MPIYQEDFTNGKVYKLKISQYGLRRAHATSLDINVKI